MQVSDLNFPEYERIPRQFTVSFVDDGKGFVRNYWNEKQIGHPLSDNNYIEDGYRYHDIIHFAHAAVLGWSPVTRWLLRKQRNSEPQIRNWEDSRRAIKLEEFLSVLIFSKHQNAKTKETWLDNFTLLTILETTSKYEVSICSLDDWRLSIKMGIEVMMKAYQQRGGKVAIDLDKKFIELL